MTFTKFLWKLFANSNYLICRYGSATYKAPAATVLDPNGKLCITLTYGKLLSRSHKIAYTLLNKTLSRAGDCCLKPGDRIALVYPNNDPISFLCAFYGCLQAGIVPVPIEVPLTRRDAGSQQIGFLLGSCGIQVFIYYTIYYTITITNKSILSSICTFYLSSILIIALFL